MLLSLIRKPVFVTVIFFQRYRGKLCTDLGTIWLPYSLVGREAITLSFRGKTIGHFRVPNTVTFKMKPSAQSFLWEWVLFAREWKIISISKAEHLTSFWYRGSGELGNGLFNERFVRKRTSSWSPCTLASCIAVSIKFWLSIMKERYADWNTGDGCWSNEVSKLKAFPSKRTWK